MAIDTTNKKLGVMEWCSIYEPGLPISPGALEQDDKQQLIHDYPGILFASLSITAGGHISNDTRLLFRHRRR